MNSFDQIKEKRTVLFVDDEKDILNALQRLLRSETYQIIFAQGGQQALDLLEEKSIHVLVTDMRMPGMDGLTLLKQVEQKHPDIIRLVLSGRGDSKSILNAINMGSAYRYLVKPWDNRELKIIIRQAIEMYSLREEKRDLLKKLEDHNRLLGERVEERTRQLLAVESQVEIGKYASQIVHNMNNPLQAILGALHLVTSLKPNRETDLNKFQEYLRIIKSGASDLKEIISGILLHARDKSHCQTEQIDINEIINGELDFFMLNPIYKNQIDKVIELADSLPHFMGNSIQIKQIIDNLIKNAIDAMEHSPEKRLMVKTQFENHALVIKISDTGEGISEEDLPRIFSPNFTTKPVGKGTGLGLASVKTMVNAYSGDIHVESRKADGTTFIVSIPVKRPLSDN